MTEDEARKLLDEYDDEVYELRATGFKSQSYRDKREACLSAMTHSKTIAEQLSARLPHAELTARRCAETIAEQQREIARLRRALHKYGNHKAGCHEKSTMDACTCGLDEVLKS